MTENKCSTRLERERASSPSLGIGSLFSGYGGLDQACEAAFGAETRWVSDIDPGACKILAHRYPDLPNHGDITRIDWSAVEPVDILTGGYPCQPFSAAGHRKGTDDERHLWPFVVEALSAMRPKFGVFENVRGHLSLGFDQVLRDLAILGYETRWCVLRAADVGAPHGRARIFILATDRQLRSRADRRGGLLGDLAREGSGHVHDPRSGGDGHERQPHPLAHEGEPRGTDHETPTGDRAERAEGRLGSRWSGGVRLHRHDPSGSDVEGRPGGLLSRVVAVDPGEPGGEGPAPLGRRSAASCAAPDAADSRGERPGSSTGAAGCAEGDAAGGAQVGRVVGAGGVAIRPGAVRGEFSDLRIHGRGKALLDADGFAYDAVLVLAADTDGLGRERSWSARGRWPGPADGGLAAADADGHGQQGVGRVVTLGRDADGRGGADGTGHAAELKARTPAADAIGSGLDGRSREAGWGPERRASAGGDSRVDWGQYAPAVERWQRVLGRVAPAPTETSAKGTQRLSPSFVEFMMGLPEGWVTEVPDLNRNAQLKALGNGVVPQQAYAAISRMLTTEAAT